MSLKMKQLINAVGRQADTLIPAISAVADGLTIGSAEGVNLDKVANIALCRVSGTDEEKRDAINAEIIIDSSIGEFDTIAGYVEHLSDSTKVRFGEIEPAEVRIHINTSKNMSEIEISEMKSIVSGGIKTTITTSNGEPFVFFGGKGKGFGTIGVQGVGGKFSRKR